jgi:hypothetical protein
LAALALAQLDESAFAQVSADPPSREEVRKALDKVANDPNLAPERKVRMLRFAESEPEAEDDSWWGSLLKALARWVRGLFVWLAESGRYVVWVLGAILAAWLAFYLVRLVRGRGLPKPRAKVAPPTHVRDLDIRPETLPDDIGAEALRLFSEGEQRAALALLYRALLSRLAHDHDVPIRASSTEGECLTLARPRLTADSARYAARLVDVWQAAVYGARPPARSAVERLCGDFAAALDRRVGSAP